MKIAVAALGRDLDAPTDPRFGRCPVFVIVNVDDMSLEAIDNMAASQGSGAGIAAVQFVANAGADAVIAANVGSNAHQALVAGGLKVYSFAQGTVREAIAAWQAGELEELTVPNVTLHHGRSGPSTPLSSDGAAEAQLQELRRQLESLGAECGRE